jgi:hypothetical protein
MVGYSVLEEVVNGRRKTRRTAWWRWWIAALGAVTAMAGFARPAAAQEPPYFVTYSHALEEPGNLEVEFKGSAASPKNVNAFGGGTLELEYGAKAWWTTELYLDGQTTPADGTVFTGFRWENRFRPLLGEHWINPVAYVEYEDVNTADRSFLEVVGNDSVQDLLLTNAQGRSDVEHELELKAIFSSNAKGWNFSENFISEKNLSTTEPEPWEFGYAVGASRPLSLLAGAKPCVFCREHFAAGAELYGGLGTTDHFGLRQTSQYFGPTVAWDLPSGPTLRFSPNFGLNDNSMGVLWRVSVSYEIQQAFSRLRRGGKGRF